MTAAIESRPFDVTNRTVFAIAAPMTVAYISTPLLGIVDTAVIGQLDDPALIGAVAVGAMLFSIIHAMFNFLRAGTTGLVAQATGAGNETEIGAAFARAMLVALVSGLVVIVFSEPLIHGGLALIDPSETVGTATADYLAIRALSTPFSLANYVILGWFLGLGRAGMGLFLQVLLNGLNIVLSVILVLGLEWGLAGVAWGTVGAEIAAAGIGLLLVARAAGGRPWPAWSVVFDARQFKRLAALNGDIMVRSLALLFAFAYFTAQSAQFDDVTLAANAVLMHFFSIAGNFLDGLATAAEQLAGRAVGARWKPAFTRTVRLTLVFGSLLALTLSAVFWIFGPLMIDFMTVSEEVRETARIYLIWAVLTPIAGVAAFQMDGIFIGATWSRDMRNMMIVSIAFYLASWWLLRDPLGMHGLWIALLIFLGARGLSLAVICPYRMRQVFG
ncbi:MAG: MATE family efflux transporter [Pseudomonadota bacterium]